MHIALVALGSEGDRWRQLKYLSGRLAKKYLDLHEATGKSKTPSGDITYTPSEVPGASVSFRLPSRDRVIDRSNPYMVARALDEILVGTYIDFSQSVIANMVTKDSLVKATLFFQPAHLQIQGYELVHPTQEEYFVFATTSIDHVPGIGRVFIGLVGSEQNLIAYPGEGLIGARAASDAAGLYSMIQYTKEEHDIDISPDRMAQDLSSRYEEATDEQRIQAAAEAFRGFAIQSAPRPTEVLFEVHHVARNIDLDALRLRTDGGGHVDLALFGAPVWIREATDRNYLSAADVVEGPGGIEERWEVLDEELRKLIRDPFHSPSWTPRGEQDWGQFGRWAAAWASRLRAEPTPLFRHPKRFRFFGLEWGEELDEPVKAGVDGWPATGWSTSGYLISRGGGIYRCWLQDERAVHPKSTRPEPLRWDDRRAEEAADVILRDITAWLLPFSSNPTRNR